MEYRLALGLAMALLCFDTWADSQSEGGLEGILDRIDHRGVAAEKAAPVRTAPARLGTKAKTAAMASGGSPPGRVLSTPVPGANAQSPAQKAGQSGVWGAGERAPSIPELDE